MAKPLTQRDIQKEKQAASNVAYTTLLNTSKQAVTIQLRAPTGVDFCIGEQTISLMPGKLTRCPSSRLYEDQIKNHQKAGRIRILSSPTQ